jgi:arylsulfatase A-like enzyme
MIHDAEKQGNSSRDWTALLILTVLTIYFYIMMEWLFFATKQSFMSNLGLVEKLRALWITPVPFILMAAILILLLWTAATVARNPAVRRISLAVGLLLPAVTLALALFLLVDNFTYTIFRFGVTSTIGYQSLVYAFLVLVLVFFCYQHLGGLRKRVASHGVCRRLGLLTLGLIIVSIAFTAAGYERGGAGMLIDRKAARSITDKPNIILLASDGLNAGNMSVYGYDRETTPFIEVLAERSLLCENCFANAGTSGGSIASMFTGRLPTQTRLVFPPDILRGVDRYRHLPGLLKELGYRNLDISIKHYADPYDLNMRKAFDLANFREFRWMNSSLSRRLGSLFGQEPEYFAFVMNDRITGRLLHAIRVRRMDNAYLEVTEGGQKRYVEYGEAGGTYSPIVSLFTFIDESPGPFFAHLHLLGTHGPKFHPERRIYSRGEEQPDDWMTDFYDDAILGFDDRVRELFLGLRKRELLDNTLIVICTDHGMGFTVNRRLPLIFIFPGGAHAGRIGANVQNLDIAPTVLDYMGLERPEWMEGRSLISGEPPADRFIFTVDRVHGEEIGDMAHLQLDRRSIGPPFHSLGSVGFFHCDRFYDLRLGEGVLEISRVTGHTAPCLAGEGLDPQRAARLIIDRLAEDGYDVSSIKTPVPVRVMN